MPAAPAPITTTSYVAVNARPRGANRRAAAAAAALRIYGTRAQSSTLVIAESGGTREISLHVLTTALVDDLASHRIADIGRRIAIGCQLAPDAVHAFTEDHLDPVDALVEHHHVERLTAAGCTHRDFFIVHVELGACGLRICTTARLRRSSNT